jgi:hypothetical protein
MKQKNIIGYSKEYSTKEHPSIKGLQIIEGKNNFPISWLNQQGYCEYQLYLEYMKGIETPATPEMTHGSEIHHQLEEIFKQDSEKSTFEDALEASKEDASMSRECFVVAPKYGIRGFIDEIWMKPDEIVIIDDKPGRTPYHSTMNQVRAYCLAFKDMTRDRKDNKRRRLRERRNLQTCFGLRYSLLMWKMKSKFTIEECMACSTATKPFHLPN